MKILLLDIEQAPNLVTVWGLFNQNIGINQIIDTGYMLCWAAKWYGEDTILFDSIYQSSRRNMVRRIYKLIDQADVVVHFNGKRFDMPVLNREFVLQKLPPPSPYKQVDLLTTARTQFRFTSNKMDHLAERLGLGKKRTHEGHALWLKCMAKDPEAWETMEDYNIQDVVLLEKLYDRFLPWIKNHPNHSVFEGDLVCPQCGGTHFHKRGYAYTSAGKYARYKCLADGCGKWFRDNKNVAVKGKFLLSNV